MIDLVDNGFANKRTETNQDAINQIRYLISTYLTIDIREVIVISVILYEQASVTLCQGDVSSLVNALNYYPADPFFNGTILQGATVVYEVYGVPCQDPTKNINEIPNPSGDSIKYTLPSGEVTSFWYYHASSLEGITPDMLTPSQIPPTSQYTTGRLINVNIVNSSNTLLPSFLFLCFLIALYL